MCIMNTGSLMFLELSHAVMQDAHKTEEKDKGIVNKLCSHAPPDKLVISPSFIWSVNPTVSKAATTSERGRSLSRGSACVERDCLLL